MNRFWIKIVNVILIAGIFLGYNQVLAQRQNAEEISRLEYELSQARQQLETQTAELLQSENAQQEEEKTDLPYADGEFIGSGQGFGGEIRVSVNIIDGTVSSVDVLSAEGEDGTYLDMAMGVIDSVVEEQTDKVDTVSGATFSSRGILSAVAEALEKAEQAK